jgi:hypothetical protein
MAGVSFEPEHPKKRRRRCLEQSLSARIVLDESLLGDLGVVSENLWTKLDALAFDNHGMALSF